MTIYERIRMLRKDRGMSQDELAKRCGYADRSMITKIEAGKVDLTIGKVEQIAYILGVDPAYLAGYSEWQENQDTALALMALIKKASELDDLDLAKLQERAETMLESDKYDENHKAN